MIPRIQMVVPNAFLLESSGALGVPAMIGVIGLGHKSTASPHLGFLFFGVAPKGWGCHKASPGNLKRLPLSSEK